MLKISSIKSAKLKKSGVGVGGDSKARRAGSKIDSGEFDSGKVEDYEIGKKVQKTSKSKNLTKFKKTVEIDFLTPRAKLAFTKLRQIFFKAPILY